MDESIRILIVDDHEVVRRGLHGIISACDDLQVVGAAASGEEAVALAKSVDPDVVLLDLQLPGLHGLEVIPELAERHDGRPKIIVLTVHDDDEIVLRAVKAGASGYVLKHASADALLTGRVVVNGVRIDAQSTAPYVRSVSLHNESHHLAGLGRWDEGLAKIAGAVDLRRQLAETRPDIFRPDLANSLNTQSTCFANLGRREEALDAAEEAVAIYRQLSQGRPEAFRGKLALSLNNQSICLGNLGQHEEALSASEEAVGIYRDLGEAAGPTRPELCRSLANLAAALDALGRHAEAAAARVEADASTQSPDH